MYEFRTTTKIDNDTYIEDRGYPHVVSRGSDDFSVVDAEFNFLEIGQTAVKSQEDGEWDVINGFPMLDYAKAEKLKEINARCDVAMSKLTADYPDTERLTFDQQKAEAEEYEVDEEAPCPMLRALAQNRGITMADLCARVKAKAALFANITGALMGQRQHMEDLLDACKTPAEVAAIQVVYTI